MAYVVGIVVLVIGGFIVLGLAIQLFENLLNWVRSLFGLKAISFSDSDTKSNGYGPKPLNESETENLEQLKTKHGSTLEEFLTKISTSSQSYYVENKTMDFLRDALAGSRHQPRHEYYNRWSNKSDVPADVKAFGKYVHDQIRAKNRQADDEKRKKEAEKNQETATSIIARHGDKFSKFLEITYRKVSTVDEYGDENPKALNEEILRLFKKISDSERSLASEMRWLDRKKDSLSFSDFLSPVSSSIAKVLTERFHAYYSIQKAKLSSVDKDTIAEMSGVEFEQYLIQQLKKCGVTDASGTSTTGDQGADVLFSFNGVRIVVQAKRYTSTVGNKAIQEVHAAKGFYKCDKAWVVTNSTFTKSAKSLAHQLDIYLMEGVDLERFQNRFDDYFSSLKTASGT
jgi:HJR/Mrr/RecB family endonuclease